MLLNTLALLSALLSALLGAGLLLAQGVELVPLEPDVLVLHAQLLDALVLHLFLLGVVLFLVLNVVFRLPVPIYLAQHVALLGALLLNVLAPLLVLLGEQLLLVLLLPNVLFLNALLLSVAVLSLAQYFLLCYAQNRATRKNLFFLLPLATKLLALNHGAITLTILKIIMKSII